MRKTTVTAVLLIGALVLGACDSEEAQITTTTLDASLLTTTTTSPDTSDPDTTEAPGTTQPPADQIESWEVINRTSDDEGETLYILVPPGNYSEVSIENFLGTLLEDETAVSAVEVFDDRAALDAALVEEQERTEEQAGLIQQHYLVSLNEGRQVEFQGPLSDYQDFVLGS